MEEEALAGGEASLAEGFVVGDAVGHEDLSFLGVAQEVVLEVLAEAVAAMVVGVDSVVDVDVEEDIVDHKRE